MTGAHRRTDLHLVRSALKAVWSLLQLVGLLAIVGITAHLIATDSKCQWIAITALQGGQRRLALALTARAVAGRWPWSAGV
jgi:hypothetical protein